MCLHGTPSPFSWGVWMFGTHYGEEDRGYSIHQRYPRRGAGVSQTHQLHIELPLRMVMQIMQQICPNGPQINLIYWSLIPITLYFCFNITL